MRYFDFGNLIAKAATVMECLLDCSSTTNLPHYSVVVVKSYSNQLIDYLFLELFHHQALYFMMILSCKYHYPTFKRSVSVIYLFDSLQIIQIVG